MKRNIILFFILLFFFSCAREEELRPDEGGAARGFINLVVTENHTGSDLPSDDIKSIRFIVFTDMDTYSKVEVNDFRKLEDTGRASALKTVLEVSRAKKLVVAIVNEPDSLKESLAGVRSIEGLENIEVDMSRFVSDDHLSIKPDSMMPMSGAVWTKRSDVHATQAAAEAASDQIQISLQRAVARVDVYLATDITGGVELLTGSSVTLKNTYNQSPFIRHEDEGFNRLGRIQTIPAGKFDTRKWNIAGPSTIRELSDTVHICTFYTPERNCATDKLAVDISLKTDDGDKSATITLDYMYNGAGNRLPIETVKRNNRYIVKGKIRKSPLIETDGRIEILKWNEGLESFPLGQYYLRVDKSLLEFPYTGGTQTVTVTTTHPDKWMIDDITNLPAGITVGTSGNTVTVTAVAKSPGTPASEGFFVIRAGNMLKKIVVRQAAMPTFNLAVDPDNLIFPYNGNTQTVTVTTDYPGGWNITSVPAGITVSKSGNAINVTTVRKDLNDESGSGWFIVKAGDLEKRVTFTQPVPELKYFNSNLPTSTQTIPQEGTAYTITATTNLQGWGVKVYEGVDNSGTLHATKPFGNTPVIGIDGEVDRHDMQVAVEENKGTTMRTFAFYLYCAEFPGKEKEIWIGKWDQEAAAYSLNVSPASLEFPNTESIKTVTVTTNHPDGWEIDGITNLPAGITVEKSGNTVNVKAGAKSPGTPASEGSFVIKAGDMSETVTVKQAEGPSAYNKMKTYGWGYYDNSAGYIMNIDRMDGTGTIGGTKKIVDAPANFGTDANSVVKIERHSATETFDHTVLRYGNGVYQSPYIKAMFDAKPDIILTGFDLAVVEPVKVAGYVMDYLRAGGVLVLALEAPAFTRQIFAAMYPGRTIAVDGTANEWDFQIANAVNDEITNGPFGDIRGRYWGNDVNTECAVKGLPENDIVVYSRTRAGDPIMFRHKNYNLFFIGDGGAFANLSGGTGPNGGRVGTALGTHPLAFDDDFKPITRTGWATGDPTTNGTGNVENGRLFANIMAWAVKAAATNGINTK